MARGPKDNPIPRALLVAQPWVELLQRLTAVAAARTRGRPIDDARQLATEAVRVFLDPASTVVWDYEREPDPRLCLGSILNGLLRNYVRVKRTNAEVPAEQGALDRAAGSDAADNPEQLLLERRQFEAVLRRVHDLSSGDQAVRQLVELARSGILEPGEQLAALSVDRATLYEARRRFRERLDAAQRELE